MGLLCLWAAPAAADAPPGIDDWKCDVVYPKKGPPLRGLVVEEGPGYVHIRCVSRKRGASL